MPSPVQAYPVKILDPARFLAAWTNAQKVTNANEVMAMPMKKPSVASHLRGGVADTFVDRPTPRWYIGVQAEFSDESDSLSCFVRFMFVIELASRGGLGSFVHPVHGIWDPAILMLATAPCNSVSGYDSSDIKARLAKLEPPPPSVEVGTESSSDVDSTSVGDEGHERIERQNQQVQAESLLPRSPATGDQG